MKKSFKTGTIKTTPSKINGWEYDGVGLEVSRFIGISTRHSIFLNYDDMGYTYLVSPESGPLVGLKKWVKKEQKFLTWTPKSSKEFPLGQMEAWKAATDHAMTEAFNEVARESDLDLPASFWNENQDLVDKRDDDEYQKRTQAGGDGPRTLDVLSGNFVNKIWDTLGPRQYSQVGNFNVENRNWYFELRKTMDHSAAYKKVVADDDKH